MARFVIYTLFIFLFLIFHPSSSSAVIYKWIDPSGTIHFSENFDDIPPAYRNNFKIITTPRTLNGTSETDRGRVIPFERTAGGLILVEAIMNDRVKSRMILDTGANLVVITEELSKKLNQDISFKNEVIKLNTNCGEVEGRSLVIQKIELGLATKRNVKSVITPNNFAFSGFDGVLGLSFLGDFKVTVDYENGRIILSE
jgi:clan AA aspartic protease (TIGR02281 family)